MEKKLEIHDGPLLTPEDIQNAVTRLQAWRNVTASQPIKVAFLNSASVYTDGSPDSAAW